jgi:hypothetical protein
VKDSTFIGNAGGGVAVLGTVGNLSRGVIEHSRVQGLGSQQSSDVGIYVAANSRVTVRDSVVADSFTGVYAYSITAGSDAVGMVEDCLISSNVTGLNALAGLVGPSTVQTEAVGGGVIALLRVSNSTIVHNVNGVTGNTISRGNNTLRDNTTDGTFSATYSPQ